MKPLVRRKYPVPIGRWVAAGRYNTVKYPGGVLFVSEPPRFLEHEL
jgi:hypothetical protein